MLWTNLRNQVRQTPLPKWKPLIPLFEPVLQNLRRLLAVTDPTRRWISAIGLAVAVGIAYFLAARLSLSLLTKSDGVAVFWPASGVAAGALIALGPGARWRQRSWPIYWETGLSRALSPSPYAMLEKRSSRLALSSANLVRISALTGCATSWDC